MAKYGTFKYGAKTYGADSLVKAGVTHHIVMDGVGLMLASPIITKSDITSSVPRVSIGTDQKKHTDFSERDTFGQQSYHHGYAANDFADPYTFLDSDNVVTWIPNQLILSPDNTNCALTTGGGTDLGGYVADLLPFEGNLYVLVYGDDPTDNALYLYNNSTDSLDTVSASLDTTSGEPKQLFAYGGNMYVAQGETVNARRFTGSTWSDQGEPADFYAAFDGYLWRADNLFELYWSSDPENDSTATWNGPIEVGDASYQIRGMVAGFDGALWIGKDDGIYSVRKTTDVNYAITKVIDLSNCVCATNGAAMVVFGGYLYISAGFTIIRYDGTTIQFVGPDRGAHETERFYQVNTQFGQPIIPSSVDLLPPTYQSGVAGYIRSFAHDNNFLYCAVDNGGAGSSRVMLWTGTGWHTVYKTSSTTRVRSNFFTRPLASSGTLSFPHMWWSDTSGSVLKRQKMSRYSHNPLDESTMTYVSSGTLTTAWFDASLVDIYKTFFDFVVGATNLTVSGNSITVEFQVDDYEVWYTLGTIYKSPESTLFFPNNDQLDPSIFAKRIRYRLTLTRDTGTTTTTPIVLSWGHRFVVRPESRYGWNLIVKVYEGMENLQRHQEDDKAVQIRRFLYGLRDKKTPIQLFDGTELAALTNYVTNPNCEIDTNGDGASDGITAVGTGVTLSQTAQFKSDGVLSQKVVLASGTGTKGVQIGTTYSVTANQNIYAAVDMYLVDGGNTVTLQVLDSGGTVVSEQAIQPSSITGETVVRFQRKYVFFTASVTDDYSFRVVRKTEDGANATTFYIDRLEFIYANDTDLSEPNGDYIDGDQLRCRWNGTPHASTSTRQKGYFVYIRTFTEAMRYLEAKSTKATWSSEITMNLAETQ